jgi:hypothetical protein
VHPWPPAERPNREARVIRDGGDPRALKEIPRLRQRVLLERPERLDIILVPRLGQTDVVQIDDVDALPSEDRAQLAELTATPRCEKQSTRQRRSDST